MPSQPSKEPRQCAQCGKSSRARDIHHVVSGSWTIVSIQLCDSCDREIGMADAQAWEWFWTLRFDSN
jgi:hypothetical protein